MGHVRSKQAEEVIEVATILKGTKTKLLTNLARMVTSMLDHSLGSNIKLTILSDPEVGKRTRKCSKKVISRVQKKRILKRVLQHEAQHPLCSSVLASCPSAAQTNSWPPLHQRWVTTYWVTNYWLQTLGQHYTKGEWQTIEWQNIEWQIIEWQTIGYHYTKGEWQALI